MYIVHRFLPCVIKNLKSIVLFDQKEQESVFWFLFIAFLSTLNKLALITKFKRNGSCFSEILCVNGINATTEMKRALWLVSPLLAKFATQDAQKRQVSSPGQRSQPFNARYRKINMLRAFRHSVVMCCDMLGVANRSSAHALALHCCTNQAKQVQRHATSTNVAWKSWAFKN